VKRLVKDGHAFLSPSKYHWINYDDQKLLEVYSNFQASQIGTKKHEYARMAIELGEKQRKSKSTLCAYINDAIGFGMRPEQLLFYSENCFGTADAILWDEKHRILRIHDLKTGVTPAHMEQLIIYAAIFCLEYKNQIPPMGTFDIELRIYQSDNIVVYIPSADEVSVVMAKIVACDKLIESQKTYLGG
jgi:hypothetical protein